MTLTSDELTDMRGDLGDVGTTPAFSDSELQRLYVRAGSYDGAVALARRQLLANAAKFVRYSSGATSEARNQIFDQLKKLVDMDNAKAGLGYSTLSVGTLDLQTDQDESTTLSSRIDDSTEWEG